VAVLFPYVALGTVLLYLLSRGLDLLLLGDPAAFQAGLSVERVKTATYLTASLLAGSVVAVSGLIGFVGLIVPHGARVLVGSGHRRLLPAAFLLGGAFLWGVDKVLPHLHLGLPDESAEGIKTTWQRSILLVTAITLHNFPEGLAVGVAFGAVAAGLPAATLPAAIALAIGIGIQNFPEGMAVAMPLRREGLSAWKSFWYGQLSGVVEPIAGVIGAAAVLLMRPILPYALSFAAGAMIFAVVEELIPESQTGKDTDIPTVGAMLGFAVMMILDVALG